MYSEDLPEMEKNTLRFRRVYTEYLRKDHKIIRRKSKEKD